MSDQQFERAVIDWFEDGSDRTPRRAIDGVLLAVKTTPQERDLRIPWRFPFMPALTRATGIAAVALVAVVATGSLIYLNSKGPAGPGATTPATTTQAPTTAPDPTFPPGITGWTRYTSEAYSALTLGYPKDWTLHAAASRMWQPGDRLGDEVPYADSFASPEEETVGLFVWEMPAGEGFDLETVEGLKAWAKAACEDIGASPCEGFADQAVPMCLGSGGGSCRGAILVPTAEQQYAFFVNWTTLIFANSPDRVRVVVVAREDGFPSAARYGGSVQLLKDILTTMDVWTPGLQPRS